MYPYPQTDAKLKIKASHKLLAKTKLIFAGLFLIEEKEFAKKDKFPPFQLEI